MVYVGLNSAFFLFFLFLTIYILAVFKERTAQMRSFIISLFSLMVLSAMFTLSVSGIFSEKIAQIFGQIILFFEACFFINISFYFLQHKPMQFKFVKLLSYVVKVVLYAFALYILLKKIDYAAFTSLKSSGSIESSYIFSGEVRAVFPIRWATLYIVFFRFVCPGFCCLIMLLRNEYRATRLERFRGLLNALALAAMWALAIFIQYAVRYSVIMRDLPQFSPVYLTSYVFFMLSLFYASIQKSVPTKNDADNFINHIFFLYIVPATLVGELYAVLFNIYITQSTLFFGVLGGLIAASLLFIWRIDITLESMQRVRSTDYEQGFERELKAIDYDEDMDVIAGKMVDIFKKYTACSSVTLFVDTGQSAMEAAISSLEKPPVASFDFELFNELLSRGRNIVAYNDIEKEQSLEFVRGKLIDFFTTTHSDVLFLLNEGQKMFACMTLGIKNNGDHYGDYDMEVFTHLYSYFFVFGYYMRNISSKDVIGIVNRELRMSSQIIASIQENVDQMQNEKVDAGYLMIPAHAIGGEFVDLIRINDGAHLCVIGSLSGRGIAASMSMVILKSIIRTFLAETHDFKELVEKVNSFIRENLPKGTIFSGVFTLMDFRTNVMYYINCGIPSMFLYTQAYNNVIEIQGRGHVLGFVRDIVPYIALRQIKLNAGDILLACTSGIINSRSLRGEQFGKERIQEVLLSNTALRASHIARAEYDSLVKFTSKELQEDISMLTIKVYETSRSLLEELQEDINMLQVQYN